MTLLLNHSLDQVRKSRNLAPHHADRNQAKTRQINDAWKHDLFENANEKSSSNPPRLVHTDHANGDDDDHVDPGRSTSLLITNLHYDVSEAELEALFSQIGKIDRGPFIKFDPSGRATEGLAFVAYANESHAEAAIEAFNGASAKGQSIGVEYEFTIPMWVRSALGMGRRQSGGEGVTPTFGLLGRMQQDRPAGRAHFSPYERTRGPRSSFPPGGGKSRSSLGGRDSRRATESFGGGSSSSNGGLRPRGGSGPRSGASSSSFSSRPRWNSERGASTRAPPGGLKSARDLDKELEAFMGSSSALPAAAAAVPAVPDVQMTE
ncbi:hypothetical protein PCANC_10299 [Puccinia coronata f. sp. avenae]|uniref:RRM domain-containing protein n=1 Tax=Puccinia coronata f. sp. avenae TaxID=200324 RepID=A0A2N5RVV6_9BASI|nr:hypothetical protein PCASD_25293 [Puccinia coronata f. sp. avenae]PLW52196.1 hypothetical protein PCANC_10299 [Puccinia coronata f. sp. avenae]